MNIIDVKLNKKELKLLKSILGKELVSVGHDEFNFVNSSSQVVQINVENEIFYLYSFVESCDYFGSIEDVALWSFEKERYKAVDFKTFVEMPIREKVKNIKVIQENQNLYRNGEKIYDVWLTRGLIFDFGDYQLSFEKAIWFSEDIYIRKGYDLIYKFAPIKEFTGSDWGNDVVAKCSRKILSLSE